MYTITDGTVTGEGILCEMVDIYKIFHVNNVSSYELCDWNRWNISTISNSTELVTGVANIYLIIDTQIDEAFGHWVYESAIYLSLFSILQERYPDIKLCLKRKRTYKTLFCRMFNIAEESIVYSLDTTIPNISIFPSPISCLNETYIPPLYIDHLTRFFQYFMRYKSTEKKYDIVILPRQLKENYSYHNRIYQMDNLLAYINSTYKGSSIIVNTDNITDLTDQIKIVSSAKCLIVTDGSAFLVNAMFAEDAHIVIIDSLTLHTASLFCKYSNLIDFIRKHNRITYCRDENHVIDILRSEK